MSKDLRDATDADCMKNTVKYTFYDKDGKVCQLQPGLNPNIESVLATFETKPSCPDCARLKALLVDVVEYIKPQPDDCHYKGHWDLIKLRLKKEGIE